LVTHDDWPLHNPGAPTVFECRADDVHARLHDPGFLVAQGAASAGAGRATHEPTEKVSADNDAWYNAEGAKGDAADEAADLLQMEADAAADLPFKISAFVVSPGGHRIHKQALVAMLNQCPVMSNDRLKRIAEGTRYMDKGGAPAEEMDGGGCAAISVSSRVFVRCYDDKYDIHRIWIGRVQKMGRKVEKKTYEYQDPVHINRIPDGCYIYCHWYGPLSERTTNKWLYGVHDARPYEMSAVRGVLKDRLTPAQNQPDNIKKNGECVLQLSARDLDTFDELDQAAMKNKKIRLQ